MSDIDIDIVLGTCSATDDGRETCAPDLIHDWANLIMYARLAEARICLELELRVAFGPTLECPELRR